MKKLIVITTFVLALALPKVVLADETCTSTYGGGVICGASVPEEHKPVETGVGDINPLVLGVGAIATSLGLFSYSRKLKEKVL